MILQEKQKIRRRFVQKFYRIVLLLFFYIYIYNTRFNFHTISTIRSDRYFFVFVPTRHVITTDRNLDAYTIVSTRCTLTQIPRGSAK